MYREGKWIKFPGFSIKNVRRFTPVFLKCMVTGSWSEFHCQEGKISCTGCFHQVTKKEKGETHNKSSNAARSSTRAA